MLRPGLVGHILLFMACMSACSASEYSQLVRRYISVDAPSIAITHVRVIDGTGSPARVDQTVVIKNGIIAAAGHSTNVALPADAHVIEASCCTLLPGLVGMHDHLFYPSPSQPGPENEYPNGHLFMEAAYTFPRLYLAAGVTTIRTAGSIEPYTDLRLKQLIEQGKIPGPDIFLTAPYFDGSRPASIQMRPFFGAEEARREVNYWADQGFTSFKAYTNVSRDVLSAMVEEAHRRGLTVLGHLCSVGYREAAELGIDSIEHGLTLDTEYFPQKKPDACPMAQAFEHLARQVNLTDPPVQQTIGELVRRNIAITSTLALFESGLPSRPIADAARLRLAMNPLTWAAYLTNRELVPTYYDTENDFLKLFKKEMEFERAFAAAGGTLMAGCDPESFGGVIAGFGNQRGLELLVEAGFSVEQAVQISTLNGAKFLKLGARIGSIEVGKRADLVLVRGDLAKDVKAIRQTMTVFKAGVGFDSERLIRSVQGLVGLQ